MKPNHLILCQTLAYDFKQEHYLITALTHCSFGIPNNERLEFLGDALLNFIMAQVLFERFPKAREGQLTRMRAHLVKRETLVKIAQYLQLGEYLYLGTGELKTGGKYRASTLADGVEALVGAIYLDGGLESCQKVILQLWNKFLHNLPQRKIKDPKTRLQEYLQASQQDLPIYKVLSTQGSPHAQYFKVECVASGLKTPTYGSGDSRRDRLRDLRWT